MPRSGDGDLGNALTMGAYPVVGGLLGLVVGRWIGHMMGSVTLGPTLIGIGVGTAAGLYLLIKEAIHSNRK